MNEPYPIAPSGQASVPLRFAIVVAEQHDEANLLKQLNEWWKLHLDVVEWIPARFRPDLCALCGMHTTPFFAAFLGDNRPIFVRTISDIPTIHSYFESLQKASLEQPLTLLELAQTVAQRRMQPFLSETEPPALSTMLIQEWVQRIETTWSPRPKWNDNSMRLLTTLSRFRERSGTRQLLEAVAETFLEMRVEQLSSLQLASTVESAVVLFRSGFPGGISTGIETRELTNFIVKNLGVLNNLRDVKSGLYRTTEQDSVIATTVAEQATFVRAFVAAGWVLGAECWNLARVLLTAITQHAKFASDGARLVLPDGNDRGTMLNDGILFAEAALDYYDATGDARWLALAETVAAIWHSRYISEAEWLDWFSVGHSLHGSVPAPFEQGIFSNVILRLRFISDNEQWFATAEKLLANTGRYVLEYPYESVSLIEGMIRLFGRDATLRGPWAVNGLPAEWRSALLPWLPDLRVDWRTPSATPVVAIGSRTIDVSKPLELHRLFTEKERRRNK